MCGSAAELPGSDRRHHSYTAVVPSPIASFGPSLAAIVVLALTEGKAGLIGLFRRMIRWRVAPGWYAVGLCLPVVLAGTATVLNVLLGAEPPSAAEINAWTGLFSTFAIVLLIQASVERGRSRVGGAVLLIIGSILLGLIIIRARLLPWWCGVLLIFAFPLGDVANAIFSSAENLLLAWLWGSMGVALLSRRQGVAEALSTEPAGPADGRALCESIRQLPSSSWRTC